MLEKQEENIKADEDLFERKYQIYNMVGKLILEGSFAKNSTKIDTQVLQTGSYILKIKGLQKTYTSQLVVVR